MVVIFTLAKLLKILLPYIKEKQLSDFDLNLFYSFYNNLYSVENKPRPIVESFWMLARHTHEKKKEVN